jgi:hypothetical protein
MQPNESAPLEHRVSELERQLTELTARFAPSAGSDRPISRQDARWALDGLRERVGDDGAGAVLYTGTVNLPTGEHYEWQYGIEVGDLLKADWAEWASTLTALGHPVRLLLLRRVLAGARSAAELGSDESLGTTGQLYHHLRLLVSAGWLHSSARGQYAVPGDRVVPLLAVLSGAKR